MHLLINLCHFLNFRSSLQINVLSINFQNYFKIVFALFAGQLIFHIFGPMVLGKRNTQKVSTISIANLKKIFSIEPEVCFYYWRFPTRLMSTTTTGVRSNWFLAKCYTHLWAKWRLGPWGLRRFLGGLFGGLIFYNPIRVHDFRTAMYRS